jgi:protoheme IX farnesyltransferase
MSKYIALTKPTILLLVVLTGAAALVMEGSMSSRPAEFLLILVGLALAGGSANAFNMYFEREIDARMSRTRNRRPLPQGLMAPRRALIFAICIGLAGVLIFLIFFNMFSALLALGTIVYYAFFYTLWLKPNTAYNIVIGGAAGSMGPVIAWAAATGSLGIAPIILFLIIFIWTPPHFWALALHYKSDYRHAGLPMMPIIKGDRQTKFQIVAYTILLVILSVAVTVVGAGAIYLTLALLLGGLFIIKSVKLLKLDSNHPAMGLFSYSIVYLLTLFVGIIIDSAWHIRL